jgi:hypothetical protein
MVIFAVSVLPAPLSPLITRAWNNKQEAVSLGFHGISAANFIGFDMT